MVDKTIILRDCQITDASVLGETQWYHVDLSGNKGLHGKLDAVYLEVENCDLDDSFDFLGNKHLGFLNIKGNHVSFKHILEGVDCKKLVCDPLSVEECYMIPKTVEVEDLEVYATMELPAHTKGQTLHLIPIVRYYFPYSLEREMDDTSPYTSYTIIDGQGIEYDPDWFKGKMQGDIAEVKFAMDIVNLFDRQRKLTFHLKLQVVDQLKEKSLVIYPKPTDSYNWVGDKSNFDGYSVQVIYEGGYSEYVTDYEIIGNEELEIGENTYTFKYKELEEKIIVNAYQKFYFETGDVYYAVLYSYENSEYNGVVESNDYERWLIVDQRGKELLDERIGNNYGTSVMSSCIWDLQNLSGISTKEVSIYYDGHKIDEADLEVLRKICKMDPLEKPTLTIVSSKTDLEDMKEEVIVEQNDFNVVFIKLQFDDVYNDSEDEEVNDWDANETVKIFEDLTSDQSIVDESCEEESQDTTDESVEDKVEESDQSIVDETVEEESQSTTDLP